MLWHALLLFAAWPQAPRSPQHAEFPVCALPPPLLLCKLVPLLLDFLQVWVLGHNVGDGTLDCSGKAEGPPGSTSTGDMHIYTLDTVLSEDIRVRGHGANV